MSKAKILKEQYDEIVELYKNGMSQRKIATMYNVSKATIQSVLVKCDANGLGTAYIKIKPEDELSVCDMYLSGKSTVEIGKMFNCSNHTVACVLEKHGIDRRHRKYAINEHYFDSVDTPNKAYILGFLYADGYNNYEKRLVSLKLQDRDVGILEAIRKEIGVELPLMFEDYHNNYHSKFDTRDQYQLSLYSAHISKTLKDKGVVQAKSLILQWPTFLQDDLYSHFLRGYIDGDGHLSPKPYDYHVEFLSAYDFCVGAIEYIERTLGVNCRLIADRYENGITSIVYISHKDQVKLFLDWLYKNADLKLKRKYDIYISKYCSEENINNTSTSVAS